LFPNFIQSNDIGSSDVICLPGNEILHIITQKHLNNVFNTDGLHLIILNIGIICILIKKQLAANEWGIF
jgi:hypothetical protein